MGPQETDALMNTLITQEPESNSLMQDDLHVGQDIGRSITRQNTQMEVDPLPQLGVDRSAERQSTTDDDSIVISTDMIESTTLFDKRADSQVKGTCSWLLISYVLSSLRSSSFRASYSYQVDPFRKLKEANGR